MGALELDASHPGPEDVYKYAEPPKYEVKTLVKYPPKNYKDKGKTPKQTIQTIGGPVRKPVDVKIGITTAHAAPDAKEITFSRNEPISQRTKPISERMQRLSEQRRLTRGRMPRITQRFKRLG